MIATYVLGGLRVPDELLREYREARACVRHAEYLAEVQGLERVQPEWSVFDALEGRI